MAMARQASLGELRNAAGCNLHPTRRAVRNTMSVNWLGIKGIGEIGIVGMNAAVANAVYNATGKRVRDLPIRPEKLL